MHQNRINEVYKLLEDITFALPNFNSPDEITSSVFHCRDRINQVEKLAVEVHRAIASTRRVLLSKKKERQIKYNDLMRNNQEVKAGKSGLDRQSIAESLLAGNDTEISELESQMTEVKYLNEAVDLRISNLNKTNSDIRLAWSVMQNTSHVVSRDITPQETEILSKDLEALDLTETLETSKKTESKELSSDDFSNVGFEGEVAKKSKKEAPKVDEDGFNFGSEETLDIEGEEVGDPVNLEEEKVEKEKKSKKEKPKDDPPKSDEETFTDSSTSSSPDDVDIDAFLDDLE